MNAIDPLQQIQELSAKVEQLADLCRRLSE